ncbi:hypothetical protein Tco_1077633, partial [Tanacetum coccineum]
GEEDVFETPKGKDSGEADISPSGLQAAETLVQVASQKTKTYTRRVKSGLKKKMVKSQSHGWTIPQLKKLSFEELKEQFERTIRSIENFIPMDSEKEKESLKRSGETLQSAEKKKQKVLDVEDIPIPESAKFVKEEEIESQRLEKGLVCILL